MSTARRAAVAIAFGAVTAPRPSLAADGDPPLRPEHRIEYTSLTAVRLNPLGLSEQADLGYRYRLYRNPGPLFRDAYLGGGPSVQLTPAFARLGGKIEIRPLTVLLLSAGYYFHGWYGSFDALQTFASPLESYSDTTIEERGDAGLHSSTTASELELRAQVIGKVGPIVLRGDVKVSRFKADLPEGDRLFYDTGSDMMVADRGVLVQNDDDLVYFGAPGVDEGGLIAGARLSIVAAPYRDTLYPAGASTENPNSPIVRLGPILAYTFYDDPDSAFNKPTIIGIAGWHLAHRFRTGEDVSQAIPYGVVAFRVEGDLWKSD